MEQREVFSPYEEEPNFLQYSLSDSKSENDILISSESEEIFNNTSNSAVDITHDETGVYGRSMTVNYVHYDSTNLYCVRPSGCCPTKGQCAGPTCFPRCCPCYNKHFRCCLPACINKPRNICIMPRTCASDDNKKPFTIPPLPQKKKKRKKKKKEETKENGEKEPEPIGESEAKIIEEAESIVYTVEEIQVEAEKIESATEVDDSYFCVGQNFGTQIPEKATCHDKCRSPPAPPVVPCIKLLLKNAFDAVCSNAISKAEYKRRGIGCDRKKLCLCTLPYKQREQILDSTPQHSFDEFGNRIKFKRECDIECPCVGERCVGSCRYRKTSPVNEPDLAPRRAYPCIPECPYYIHPRGKEIQQNKAADFEHAAQDQVPKLLEK